MSEHTGGSPAYFPAIVSNIHVEDSGFALIELRLPLEELQRVLYTNHITTGPYAGKPQLRINLKEAP